MASDNLKCGSPLFPPRPPSGVPRIMPPSRPPFLPKAPVLTVNGEGPDRSGNVVVDISGKADKVVNPTDGNFAGLDGSGNLVDSGSKASDFQPRLTFDNAPTEGSQNPVTSDGIKRALDAATPADYDQVKAQVGENAAGIAGIEAVIPNQATAQNQLADKEFVNSSIATNTATFRGTYNLVSDLGLTVAATEQQVATAIAAKLASLVPENNDYCFVQVPYDDTPVDPAHVERIDRYKCTVVESGGVTTRTWGYEFSLNNSSFTAVQWAAINSGVTSEAVQKLGALPTAQELAAALLGKYEKPSGGIPKSDLSSAVQTSLGKADTALQSADVVAPSTSASTAGKPADAKATGDALAGKASTADATLSPVYSGGPPQLTNWSFSPAPEGFTLGALRYDDNISAWALDAVNDGAVYHAFDDSPEDATSLSFGFGSDVSIEPFTVTANRVRTDIIGYTLGGQTTKPLAPAAEAEALRNDKLDKSAVVAPSSSATAGQAADAKATGDALEPLLFAQYYPEGNVKSAAEFTAGIKYNAPDTTHRTITVKPFCNTGTATDDNSNLVGRVVIPPFVDAQGNPYVSDDGTRYKVVGISGDRINYNDNTNLTAIVAPNTLTTIGSGMFLGCSSLTTISFPAVSDLGEEAFYGCDALTSVSLPAVTTTRWCEFEDCYSLASVSLPVATNIGDNAFPGCINLTSVSLPAATSIGDYTFNSCTSLTSVSLPAVTNLGNGAFYECTSLASVSLPSVTNIGYNAFYSCASLASVDFGATLSSVPTLGADAVFGEDAFYRVPTSCKIIVPDSLYDAWIAADRWRDMYAAGYKFLRHSEWEYARKYELAAKAPLASPAFTGTPTAPTPTAGDSSTKVATTAFVQSEVGGKANSAAIAPEFSSSSAYAVGDVVMHGGLRYKCTTAVSTAGAWNASDWTLEPVQTASDAKANASDLRYSFNAATVSYSGNTATATDLIDRARNYVPLVGTSFDSATVNLPAATAGKMRDFYVWIAIHAPEAPSLTWIDPATNADAGIEFGEDSLADIDVGHYLILFTEIDQTVTNGAVTAAKWLVSVKHKEAS